MNNNYICVFDLETSSAKPSTTQILSLGAVILDARSLEQKSEFYSLFKPTDVSAVEEGALKVNNLTLEELDKAPETPVIFSQFVSWLTQYNKSRSKTYSIGAPIAAGYNIDNFDLPIVRRYCKTYGFGWDDKREDQFIFNQIYSIDVLKFMFWLNYSSNELPSLKLGEVLQYMGAPPEVIAGSHNALVDVQNTAHILRKVISLSNYLTQQRDDGTARLKLKNSLANIFVKE
jgi:inhibitor of KinA sporulation pathway (predicted exonuclease)